MTKAQLVNSAIGLAGALCAGVSQMWPHYQLLLLPIAAFLGGLACPQIAKEPPVPPVGTAHIPPPTINGSVTIGND